MSERIKSAYFDNINEPELEYLFWLGMPRDEEHALVRIQGGEYDPAAIDFTIDVIGVRIKDSRESNTGGLLEAKDLNGLPCRIEVWLTRTRRVGIAAAYEEAFDVNKGIWRARITFLEFISIKERAEAITKIIPGIALLAQVDQQGTFQEDTGYGGYTREQLISNNLEAVESMAQKQKYTAEIKPFTVDDFRKNYPFALSRTAIYNYVKKHEFQELEQRYTNRCRELRSQED